MKRLKINIFTQINAHGMIDVTLITKLINTKILKY